MSHPISVGVAKALPSHSAGSPGRKVSSLSEKKCVCAEAGGCGLGGLRVDVMCYSKRGKLSLSFANEAPFPKRGKLQTRHIIKYLLKI